MNTTFARLYGVRDILDTVAVSGRTDRAIVTDAFRAFGVEPSADQIERLRDEYITDLMAELHAPTTGAKGVLPGVPAVIAALAERDDVSTGLLTGNFRTAAEMKLGYFDLWRQFSFGAYGDDHVDRRDLVPVALDACRRSGLPHPPARVVVIGDTPGDIDCAHAHGAVAVGVATGPYELDALKGAGADLAVPTLEHLQQGTRWLDELLARVG
jgi:phosphoglycolate phosphatase-like HAD superfamily hydrolase